jgi:hypothetical protein
MNAAAMLSGLIVGVVVAVLGGLAIAEARGWLSYLQGQVVDRATGKLPLEARERYREEWQALLADYADRPLTALVQAFSLYLRAGAIAAELTPAPQPVERKSRAKATPPKRASSLAGTSVAGWLLREMLSRLPGKRAGSVVAPAIAGMARPAIAIFRVAAAAGAGLSRRFIEVVVDLAMSSFEFLEELIEFLLIPFTAVERAMRMGIVLVGLLLLLKFVLGMTVPVPFR